MTLIVEVVNNLARAQDSLAYVGCEWDYICQEQVASVENLITNRWLGAPSFCWNTVKSPTNGCNSGCLIGQLINGREGLRERGMKYPYLNCLRLDRLCPLVDPSYTLS